MISKQAKLQCGDDHAIVATREQNQSEMEVLRVAKCLVMRKV